MSLISTFRAKVKNYLDEADRRAERRLAKAKTKTERERVKASIERDRLKIRREVAEAKTALLKAESRRKKAEKEVRDIGGGIFSGLFAPRKGRVTRRRRTTRKK